MSQSDAFLASCCSINKVLQVRLLVYPSLIVSGCSSLTQERDLLERMLSSKPGERVSLAQCVCWPMSHCDPVMLQLFKKQTYKNIFLLALWHQCKHSVTTPPNLRVSLQVLWHSPPSSWQHVLRTGLEASTVGTRLYPLVGFA